MRELDTALICQTVADMVVQANCCIGADVMESLRQGRDREAFVEIVTALTRCMSGKLL